MYFAGSNYPLNSQPASDLKKVLILTAGFGEGHNSAARGIRDSLSQAAPGTEAEIRDIFAETYGPLNELARRVYLSAINRVPSGWASIYSWIDRQEEFRRGFRWLYPARRRLAELIGQSRPDVVVSVYPAYPHLLDHAFGTANGSKPKRVVVITDSITVNGIWFRCSADHFVVANSQTRQVLQRAGVTDNSLQVLGFPVSPRFANPALRPLRPLNSPWQILYMVNSGSACAPILAKALSELPNTRLTVTVGHEKKLRRAIEAVREGCGQKFHIVGWTNDLPRLLASHHLLISKAGGATVQEAIAAGCPMIINQVVPGQEEGNAQLISETGSGVTALTTEAVIDAVRKAIADDGKELRNWTQNIAKISRPGAALDIAAFLLGL